MIQKVNLSSSANTISELFQYLNVGQLNNHMLNIITAENRILDFHVHEESDEMFYIIEGTMQIELDENLIELNTGDFRHKQKNNRPVCVSILRQSVLARFTNSIL